MRGNRRIVLREPQPTGERDASGAIKKGEPKNHVVYAVREKASNVGGGGSEGLIAADVLGGEWRRIYKFREDAVLGIVDETWSVIDENGIELDIEAVAEVNSGARRRWLQITCERKSPRRGYS